MTCQPFVLEAYATELVPRVSHDARRSAASVGHFVGYYDRVGRRFYAMPRFEMSRDLRGGRMVYEEDGRTLEFRWEMSGAAGQHILLAPLDLDRWTAPAGERVPVAKQLEILAQLRDWLSNQQIRSDIERPPSTASGQRCAWVGCTDPRLDGLTHCALHFDMMLLARES